MAKLPKYLTTVTSLSKMLAAILFVSLPVVAFILGTTYQSQLDKNLILQLQVEKSLPISP